MHATARLCSSFALGLLLAGAAGACGSEATTDPDPGGTTSRTSEVTRPYPTARRAAMGFISWFKADASDCGEPNFVLHGRLPDKMLDGFSCQDVMSPSEVAQHCTREAVVSAGDPQHRPPVTLAPDKIRFFVGWGAEATCDQGKKQRSKGTYEIVVHKAEGGWSLASYKILTGPGAGTTG